MKKIMSILFVILAILTSCSVSKNIFSNHSNPESDFTQVSVTVLLPGQTDTSTVFNHLYEDDSTFFNKYLVQHIKSGYYQELSYGFKVNLWSVEDSLEVKIVDTLQYHVLFRELK